jgi:Mat/Ecp fimbriae major subunit
MKTFKTILAAVLFLSATTGLMAQNQASTSATASAEIIALLSLEKVEGAEIDFGIIAQGTTATLNPNTSAVENGGLQNSSTSVGAFIIGGAPGASVLLNFDQQVTLDGPDASLTMNTNLVYNSDNDQASAGQITTSASNIELSEGDAGNGYIWVGGEIEVSASQTVGTYSGTFSISVEYN